MSRFLYQHISPVSCVLSPQPEHVSCVPSMHVSCVHSDTVHQFRNSTAGLGHIFAQFPQLLSTAVLCNTKSSEGQDYTTSHCIELLGPALHCTVLQCTVLYFTALIPNSSGDQWLEEGDMFDRSPAPAPAVLGSHPGL